eukprot:gnl/TRDRNA2_/TRDRNA2_33642_c0_seq1.p1 gnl/TRDRNA2_/TRDRNA2_33642_c0~~gnl/TRDRNA2_/TRDRNA2_33642_c0_seq1.p1  ORF type:complete len:303 (+),score=52.03 gnl/TRDRNA2_/TRDRNA2_33642_c0_seq1:61-909(+)
MAGIDRNFYVWVLPMVLLETVLFAYAFGADLRTRQVIIGLLGFYWCFAALWVEIKIEQAYPHFDYENPSDPEMKAYKPFCDFASWANCSKVLMSPPGRILRTFGIAKQHPEGGLIDKIRNLIDVPNPGLGVMFFACHFFYPGLLMIADLEIPFITAGLINMLAFAACCFVGLMTIWLAYNLFIVLQDFCVVCVSMYVANFALIPLLYTMMKENVTAADLSWFGTVPFPLLVPFCALCAGMGVAVVGLYFFGGTAHARELEQPLEDDREASAPLPYHIMPADQ